MPSSQWEKREEGNKNLARKSSVTRRRARADRPRRDKRFMRAGFAVERWWFQAFRVAVSMKLRFLVRRNDARPPSCHHLM